jgi:exodeoxyribonuclease VIII
MSTLTEQEVCNALCRGTPTLHEPGIYTGLSRERYDNIPALSATVIKKWGRRYSVPSVFKHWLKTRWDEPQTEALLLGSALDCLRLEREFFNHRYTTVPPDAPKRPSKVQINAKKPSPETLSAIAFWNKFNEENSNKTILTNDQMALIHGMDHALEKSPATDGLFANCSKVVLVGEVYGLPAKAEIDLWNPRTEHIMDIKTAVDVSMSGFLQSVDRFDYLVQAAWYLLLAQSLNFDKQVFDFVAVGNEEPYPVKVHPFICDGSQLKHSLLFTAVRQKVKRDAFSLMDVLADGKFEDDPDWHPMEFPEWFITKMQCDAEAI